MSTCEELLKRQKEPHQPEGRAKRVDQVDLHLFSQLHPQGRTLIRDFAKRANDGKQCADHECFEPFIFGWMAMNGWAACVTQKEFDGEYVRTLARDESLEHRFRERLDACDEFRKVTQKFRALWPIFRSQDVRSIPNPIGTREEIVREYGRTVPEARYSPACYFRHELEGSIIPADWPHTVCAIYQVRCNLFHGFKGLYSENDTAIVSAGFRVLVHVIQMLKLQAD